MLVKYTDDTVDEIIVDGKPQFDPGIGMAIITSPIDESQTFIVLRNVKKMRIGQVGRTISKHGFLSLDEQQSRILQRDPGGG